jgi:hypothetical protein
MTAIATPQAPLADPAFDELGGSFRGELLFPTSPGYDTDPTTPSTTTSTSSPADAQERTKGGQLLAIDLRAAAPTSAAATRRARARSGRSRPAGRATGCSALTSRRASWTAPTSRARRRC